MENITRESVGTKEKLLKTTLGFIQDKLVEKLTLDELKDKIKIDRNDYINIFTNMINSNPNNYRELFIEVLFMKIDEISDILDSNIKDKIITYISKLDFKNFKDTKRFIENLLFEMRNDDIHLIKLIYAFINNQTITITKDIVDLLINKSKDEKNNILIYFISSNSCDYTLDYLFNYANNKEEILSNYIDEIIYNCNDLYKLRNYLLQDGYLDYINKVDNKINKLNKQEIMLIYILNSLDDNIKKDLNETSKWMILKLIESIIKNNKEISTISLVGKGNYSNAYKIGNKVLKLGNNRYKLKIVDNPYILKSLIRNFIDDEKKIFCQVTEYVDTKTEITKEELYTLYKNLRNIGLHWTDIKKSNVGRLLKDNKIYWDRDIADNLNAHNYIKRLGNEVLKAGNIVLIDDDYLFEEKETADKYIVIKPIYDEFSKRYEAEKEQIRVMILNNNIEPNETNSEHILCAKL